MQLRSKVVERCCSLENADDVHQMVIQRMPAHFALHLRNLRINPTEWIQLRTLPSNHEHLLGIRPPDLALWSSNHRGYSRDRSRWLLRDTWMGAKGSPRPVFA